MRPAIVTSQKAIVLSARPAPCVAGAPTSAPRNARGKWSSPVCDRNFIKAWGDSSSLERGRAMSNEHWLRFEGAARGRSSATGPRTVKSSSAELDPVRRDPPGARCHARGGGTHSAPRTTLQRTSATGSSAATSRRSTEHVGSSTRPVSFASSVAPFGVSAIPCLAHTNRAFVASGDLTYEVQETDGVDLRSLRAPQTTAGDGCPDVVLIESAVCDSQRGIGWPSHHVPAVTRGLRSSRLSSHCHSKKPFCTWMRPKVTSSRRRLRSPRIGTFSMEIRTIQTRRRCTMLCFCCAVHAGSARPAST